MYRLPFLTVAYACNSDGDQRNSESDTSTQRIDPPRSAASSKFVHKEQTLRC
jgi:hypothetical protein